MKSMSLLFIFFCFCIAAKAQTQSTDSLYIVTYTTGSTWNTSLKPNEQPYFKEHSANLSALRKAGTIKFGARYADKGIIVFKAASLQAATDLINTDRAVANKLFNADVQKLNAFYPWKE
jgi:hypothetical protein